MISANGNLQDLISWTDAGFAGTDTHSQSGLIITWGGSIISWRSSKQSVSALSTAEAGLYAASLGWQVVEGTRHLVTDLGIQVPHVQLFIDNKAAITIAGCGANWRTRYFAVRAHRLHEEIIRGAATLDHCPTNDMVADALTKLGTGPMFHTLHEAMAGRFPDTPTAIKNRQESGGP